MAPYKSPREVLIDHARAAKDALDRSLEGGYREWQKQNALLAEYQEFLDAADKLADIKRPSGA